MKIKQTIMNDIFQKTTISLIDGTIRINCEPEDIEEVFSLILNTTPNPCEIYKNCRLITVKIPDADARDNFFDQITN